MKAKIIKIEDFSYCDEPEHFYAGPDRTDYKLEAIGCTLEEFVAEFIDIDSAFDFCATTEGMTDIGGTRLNLQVGTVIEIDSWRQILLSQPIEEPLPDLNYMELIELNGDRFHEERRQMVRAAQRKLGLGSEFEPAYFDFDDCPF